MAADSLEDLFAPITWNSDVRIARPELATRCGFDRGAVVGMLSIETAEQAETFGVSIGARVLDVEGPDGTTITIPFEDAELLDR